MRQNHLYKVPENVNKVLENVNKVPLQSFLCRDGASTKSTKKNTLLRHFVEMKSVMKSGKNAQSLQNQQSFPLEGKKRELEKIRQLHATPKSPNNA